MPPWELILLPNMNILGIHHHPLLGGTRNPEAVADTNTVAYRSNKLELERGGRGTTLATIILRLVLRHYLWSPSERARSVRYFNDHSNRSAPQ